MDKNNHVEVIVLNSHGVGQVCNIKRLPALGETLRAWNWRIEEDGGKGTAVAVALGRLGVKVGYVGKVGNDMWGDLGEKWMSEVGVDTTYMYRSNEVATGTGLIMIDEEGRNTIVDGDSACEALTLEEIETAIEAMKDAKAFVTGFAIPEEFALAGAKMAKQRGITTLLNASPLPEQPMGDLSYIDYLVVNEVEGKFLIDEPQNTNLSYAEIAKRLKAKYRCGTVVMTLGENGSVIFTGDDCFAIDPIRVDVTDTTGAGDCYLAALTANLVWEADIHKACEWAGKYSALKVTRQGTIRAYPTLKETEIFVSNLSA